MAQSADDPTSPSRVAAFAQGLQELGWTVGANVRIDYRWATSDADPVRYATELVALAPDVILATSGATVGALQQASRTVPIVFVTTIDPVGGGWVASLARPGGNATGFNLFEYATSGKWLELLKEVAPGVTRVAVLRPANIGGGRPIGRDASRGAVLRGRIEATRRAHQRRDRARRHCIRAGVERRPDRGGERISNRSSRADHRARGKAPIAGGVRLPLLRHRWRTDLVRARYRRPVSTNGVLRRSHPQGREARRPAGQSPTKYELVINLKTAKVLGLEVPASLLARADEMVE